MHTTGLVKDPLPLRGPDPDAMTIKNSEAKRAVTSVRPRPFRERRRTRPLNEARHEALESVNQLLIRYENTIDKLHKAEEEYRSIYEDAQVGMFHISPTGKPLSLNNRMAEICGYDAPDQFMAQVSDVTEQLLVEP